MKKVFIPKMGSGSASQSRFFRANLSPEGGGGGNAADENEEIKSIEAIGEQVVKFKEQLGDKADKKAFEDLEAEIKTLKEGIETLTSKQVMESIEKINTAWKRLGKDRFKEKKKQKKTNRIAGNVL